MLDSEIHEFLEEKYLQYHTLAFIPDDPICIPHLFTKKQDIEIMALFSALFSWGMRKTIILKAKELINRMDRQPYQFIVYHTKNDLKVFKGFKHRTFLEPDAIGLCGFLKNHYTNHDSLSSAFKVTCQQRPVFSALQYFHDKISKCVSIPLRSLKHFSSPQKNSACKRLNMFLRWMVRQDNLNIDFGLWNHIKPHQLICPLDVHVSKVSYHLGLIPKLKSDWIQGEYLTEKLKTFDAHDPIKYDFALFNIGRYEKKALGF